jgi:hypothetical protein
MRRFDHVDYQNGSGLGMNEVTITVSGRVGSGKSAVCGEIEILCRALGLQVEWIGGRDEKNLTGADWIHEIEMYKPVVKIVEQIESAAPSPAAALTSEQRKNLMSHADDMDACGWKDDAKALRALLREAGSR